MFNIPGSVECYCGDLVNLALNGCCDWLTAGRGAQDKWGLGDYNWLTYRLRWEFTELTFGPFQREVYSSEDGVSEGGESGVGRNFSDSGGGVASVKIQHWTLSLNHTCFEGNSVKIRHWTPSVTATSVDGRSDVVKCVVYQCQDTVRPPEPTVCTVHLLNKRTVKQANSQRDKQPCSPGSLGHSKVNPLHCIPYFTIHTCMKQHC